MVVVVLVMWQSAFGWYAPASIDCNHRSTQEDHDLRLQCAHCCTHKTTMVLLTLGQDVEHAEDDGLCVQVHHVRLGQDEEDGVRGPQADGPHCQEVEGLRLGGAAAVCVCMYDGASWVG